MAPSPPLTRIQAALLRASSELTKLNLPFALVGGLAVSLRGEPRFTRDIDLAVSVASDRDTESIILALQAKRYRVFLLVEQESKGRIATVRLQAEAEEEEGVVVDLLFASCGIETELVHAAEQRGFQRHRDLKAGLQRAIDDARD